MTAREIVAMAGVRVIVHDIEPDEIAAHHQNELLRVFLGPDVILYFATIAAAREALVVELGRKLAHLEVVERVEADPEAEDGAP
jgi:hypothetical protein